MNTTLAKSQIKRSHWVPPEYRVQYTLKVDDRIKNRVNRAYLTLLQDVFEELAPVKKQAIDQYVGIMSKNMR